MAPQYPTARITTPVTPALPVSTPSVEHHSVVSHTDSRRGRQSADLRSSSFTANATTPTGSRPPFQWTNTEWHNSRSSASGSFTNVPLDEKPRTSVNTPPNLNPSPRRAPVTINEWPLDEKVQDPSRGQRSLSVGPSSPHGRQLSPDRWLGDPLQSRNRSMDGVRLGFSYTPASTLSRARYCPNTNANAQPLIPHQRHYAQRTRPPPCVQVPPHVRPWLPMATWFATTIGFLLAIAFWRTEVFEGLDDLSSYLKGEGYVGQAILFFLLFLTTFPPLPLYSTLIILAGYTYGAQTGFVISYLASIIGALVVFLIFRHVIPTNVTTTLLPPSLKRVVCAIERRPSIFFLIRVAPYPYNVLNAVLGSSSTMGLSRYLGTTALSLCKIIVHTLIGSEIQSFKQHYVAPPSSSDPSSPSDPDAVEEWTWKEIWTVSGIVLCVVLFVYLTIVARRAVDELDDGTGGLPTTTAHAHGSVHLGLGPNGHTHPASPNPYSSPPRRTRYEQPEHAAMEATFLHSSTSSPDMAELPPIPADRWRTDSGR